MPESFSKEDLRKRVRWYIGLRWFFVLSLGITGIVPQLLQQGFVSQVKQNVGIIILMLIINSIFLASSSSRSLRYGAYQALAVAQLILDIIIITGVVYFNGGIENIIVTLYVIPIIMSGALLGRTAIYMTGLAAAALYDAILLLDYRHVITPQNILAPSLHSNTEYVIQAMFFAPAMLLTITVITDFVAKLIRERTQLSSELKLVAAERAEMEAIIKTMGSALVAVDLQGKITTINDAFEQLTGWSSHEVLGADLDTILPLLDEHGKKVELSQRPLMRLLNAGPQAKTAPVQRVSRYYYAKKDGSIFPFVGSVAPIIVFNKITGATTVFEDASSVKQINQLKTNFMALASHQLKTPLGEIQGYVENMLQGITGPINQHQAKYLLAIHEITLRSNKLITDLLDSSVLEQGSIRVNLEATKLSDIINKVAVIYHDRVKQKSITLKVVETDKNIVVKADKDQLVEIIGNVVANAVSYTKHNTTITIETKKDDGFGLILVTDQGKGMDKKVMASLFQKDDVLSSAPAAEGGTGVGLYLAKQLLALQKGDISVLSSTAEGTTMAIKVPLGGKEMPDRPAQTKTILLVDDELPFRQIYKEALSTLYDFKVLEAEDGDEALEMVQKQPPDLILLDLVMPKKSGFDLLNQLKTNPKYKHIPIIVYSVLSDKSEIDRAMKLGANDYTIKGLTPAMEVVDKAKSLLKIN